MRRGPGPTELGISLALHAILLVPLVVFARPPEPIQFETIKLNLVSPPPTDVVEPEPAPPEPEPEPEPQPTPVEPEPEPEPEAPPEEETPPEPEPEPQPDIEKPPETPEERPEPTDEPPDSAATGGENLNIATEGRELFPEYFGNVVIQVNRYFRWTGGGSPVATVYFEILPDGSVRNIRIIEPSGNRAFDFTVMGAVEAAGSRKEFGSLPDAWAGPYMPISLVMEPSG